MMKNFYTNISFQVMIIIAFGLITTAIIQLVYSERIIEKSMLNSTKKQAFTYLLGIERQVQSLRDPFNANELTEIFRNAHIHDISNLDFAIINVYMYDRLGKVIAFLHEPETSFKDLDSYYGKVLRSQKAYLGEEIQEHHAGSSAKLIRSTDIITPIHYNEKIIGGLEVEIDLNKTFTLIKQQDNLYEFKISAMLFSVLLLLLTFIWAILHIRLISPMKEIGHVTNKIADGDLKARVNLQSKDEIGLLSRSVDTMASSLEKQFSELDDTYLGTLNALSKALEAKDDYTANHSVNVTKYALDLGRHLGLPQEQLETLEQGAMLHDLGKIGVPDDILKKTDQLTGDERAVIQLHARLTSTILDPLEKFKHFSAIARHHHERWDGKGYPDGLNGEDIPLLARIVAITDTWDAMISDRVYRKGMYKEQALQILEQERDCGQWDPYLVDQFVTLLRKNNLYELPSVDIAA